MRRVEMIKGIHHPAIVSPNLDRALEFYEGLLGFERVWETGWDEGREDIDRHLAIEGCAAKLVMLWTGSSYLEIFEFSSPEGRPIDPASAASDHGIRHLCIDVEDMDGEYQRLVDAGVRFNAPPLASFGVSTVYARDFDGNIVEFQEVLHAPQIQLPESRQRVGNES